ncbi:MAG TPA: zinc ribbon domain-containing protein [Solirubrobacteraceae bacterium]
MRITGHPQDGRDDRHDGRSVPLPAPLAGNGPHANGHAGGEVSPRPLSAAAATGRSGGGAGEPPREPADRELIAKRDRLIERFAAMQLDLGGVYYEMAIRAHVNDDVLVRKAAEMQRVDAELTQVEQVLESGGPGAGRCPSCEALHAPGAAFCSQCGSPLAASGSGAGP